MWSLALSYNQQEKLDELFAGTDGFGIFRSIPIDTVWQSIWFYNTAFKVLYVNVSKGPINSGQISIFVGTNGIGIFKSMMGIIGPHKIMD